MTTATTVSQTVRAKVAQLAQNHGHTMCHCCGEKGHHVSEMANRYIKDPNEVVKVHQKVQVKVVEIDKKRKRISLSMK